jgi:DME family drug/metabolite transporter
VATDTSPHAHQELRARVGLAQVCAAGLIWGTIGVVVQLVHRHSPLSALTIGAWRAVVAGVVVVVAALLTRRVPAVVALVRAHPLGIAGAGLLTASFQLCYFVAVVAVGVSIATVVALGLAPVLLVVVDAVRRRAPSALLQLPVLAAVGGLALVCGGSGAGTTGPHPVVGVVFAVLSGASYAGATAMSEPLSRRADPLTLAAATMVVASLAMGATGLLAGAVREEALTTTDPIAVAGLVYLGAVTMALAYGLLYAGLRTTPSGAALVATLLEPVVAIALSAVFLGERLGAAGVVGSLLIVVAIASLGRREGPPPEPH